MLILVLLALAVVGVGLFVVTREPSPPADNKAATAPRPEPRPAPPVTTPAPETKAPVEEPRAAEPRRRAPAAEPAPAATPEPAPAPPDLVTLRVETDVPDAQVFLDRVFLGQAPLTTTDVKAGSHRLNVSAAGYEGVAQSIDLKPGDQQVRVNLREVRLDASLDVVHKHRMGSCKGRLVATPQGIRYETTDKDDAFRSGLLDLDTFEVDYLEKNLRIKLKSGKRLDFTDPGGKADNLFVFHRDVDKARERLKKGDPPASQ
jgi:hypothetical protein